jgi:hypothetical protein
LVGVVDRLELGVACGTERDGSPSGSISRSKIAELDEWMLAGELGILLGLLLPNRVTGPGVTLSAAGGNPWGNPAYPVDVETCGCVPGVVYLSGLVACLEGFVGVAFGTLRVEDIIGEAAGDEERGTDAIGTAACLLAEIGDDELGSGGVWEISEAGFDIVEILDNGPKM